VKSNWCFLAVFGWLVAIWGAPCLAEERVLCRVEHNGETVNYDVKLAAQPYLAVPILLDDNFRFKAEAVGADGKIAYLNIYVFDFRRGDQKILHHAKYQKPGELFAGAPLMVPFTGRVFVYSALLGHEIAYECMFKDLSHD
jgi:hypothetical protein